MTYTTVQSPYTWGTHCTYSSILVFLVVHTTGAYQFFHSSPPRFVSAEKSCVQKGRKRENILLEEEEKNQLHNVFCTYGLTETVRGIQTHTLLVVRGAGALFYRSTAAVHGPTWVLSSWCSPYVPATLFMCFCAAFSSHGIKNCSTRELGGSSIPREAECLVWERGKTTAGPSSRS